MVVSPYNEKQIGNVIVRHFSCEVPSEEHCWHQDRKDRIVEVLDGNDWLFQMDDCIPVIMKRGDVFRIPAEKHHRIKRGTTDLFLRIQENP